jgi:hypothetical protein
MTKVDRTAAWSRLGKEISRWQKLSETDLFEEVKREWPSVVSATRDECLRFLVLNFVSRHFDA